MGHARGLCTPCTIEHETVIDDTSVHINNNSESPRLTYSMLVLPPRYRYENKWKQHYRLAIVVNSGYVKRRSNARETWIKRLEEIRSQGQINVIYFFVCMRGNTLDEDEELKIEAKENGDMLLFDVVNSHDNMLFPTMSAMKWVHENIKFDFLLKTDDDCLLNLDNILNILDGQEPNVFMGTKHSDMTLHPMWSEQSGEWKACRYFRGDEKCLPIFYGKHFFPFIFSEFVCIILKFK